jgi:hypothetical protein
MPLVSAAIFARIARCTFLTSPTNGEKNIRAEYLYASPRYRRDVVLPTNSKRPPPDLYASPRYRRVVVRLTIGYLIVLPLSPYTLSVVCTSSLSQELRSAF